MTKRTQRFQPLLNWVKFLFCKLSTIAYELFLRNKAKFSPPDPKKTKRTQNKIATVEVVRYGNYETNPIRILEFLGSWDPVFLVIFTKQTQISSFSIENQRLPEKQSQIKPKSPIGPTWKNETKPNWNPAPNGLETSRNFLTFNEKITIINVWNYEKKMPACNAKLGG